MEEPSDPAGDIFLMASCNDWLPIKMKTKRLLALEKVGFYENAPPTILNNDNVTLLFANYVAPGPHYFYFVQGVKRVFLSPNYPTVRFKGTHVFTNRVVVKPKVHEFESVFTLKDAVGDEEVFLIDHSVFARYECEQMP